MGAAYYYRHYSSTTFAPTQLYLALHTLLCMYTNPRCSRDTWEQLPAQEMAGSE